MHVLQSTQLYFIFHSWSWWNAIAGWGLQPSNVLNKDHSVQTARKAASEKGCVRQVFTPRAVSLPPNFIPAVFQAKIKPSWLCFFLAVWIILGCWWGFGNCNILWNGGERGKQCGKSCFEGWLHVLHFSLAKGPTCGMTLHSAPMDNNLMASQLPKRESAQPCKSHATYLCLTSLNNVTVVTMTVRFYGTMRFIQPQTGTNHGVFERWEDDRKNHKLDLFNIEHICGFLTQPM